MNTEGSIRHSGFVVGKTSTGHGDYWTVRIKDSLSPYNGKKFKVVPQQDITLVAGLTVSFLIGKIGREEVEKAFDIKIA